MDVENVKGKVKGLAALFYNAEKPSTRALLTTEMKLWDLLPEVSHRGSISSLPTVLKIVR